MNYSKILTNTLHISLFLLTQQQILATTKPMPPAEQEIWMTIFVHGIMSIQPHLNVENILRLLNDRIEGSSYQLAVREIRTDPFFHRNQAMQNVGLLPIDKKSAYAGDTSCALAVLMDQVSYWKSGQLSDNNLYYTYGWSGLLSPRIRLQESHDFYLALIQEIDRLRACKIRPKIRIIGYSHGGNIVLGLAQAYAEDAQKSLPLIDEIVFLGVPIQVETDHFVTSPLFKKIYNFYSLLDRIQSAECFSFKRFGSQKYFIPRSNLQLPNNLVQIEFKLLRNTKLRQRRAKQGDKRYNFNDTNILAGRSHGLRNSSPGHCELWFFGWTHAHYRSYFPLIPLPIVVILPYVLDTIKEIEDSFSHRCHLVADIRPHQETMIIRAKYDYKKRYVIPFLSQEQLEELKDTSREFSFKKATYQDYKEHIKAAFKRAHIKYAELSQKRCP